MMVRLYCFRGQRYFLSYALFFALTLNTATIAYANKGGESLHKKSDVEIEKLSATIDLEKNELIQFQKRLVEINENLKELSKKKTESDLKFQKSSEAYRSMLLKHFLLSKKQMEEANRISAGDSDEDLRRQSLEKMKAAEAFESIRMEREESQADREDLERISFILETEERELSIMKIEAESRRDALERLVNLERQTALSESNATDAAMKRDAAKRQVSAIQNLRRNHRVTDTATENLMTRFRAREELKKMQEGVDPKEALAFLRRRGSFEPPVAGKVVIPYGQSMDLETGLKIFNKGISVKPNPSPNPVNVIAMADGKVSFVGDVPGRGLVILVEHIGHIFSLIGNVSSVSVKAGENVKEGSVLGDVASTSIVYFELRSGTVPYNPGEWIKL